MAEYRVQMYRTLEQYGWVLLEAPDAAEALDLAGDTSEGDVAWDSAESVDFGPTFHAEMES